MAHSACECATSNSRLAASSCVSSGFRRTEWRTETLLRGVRTERQAGRDVVLCADADYGTNPVVRAVRNLPVRIAGARHATHDFYHVHWMRPLLWPMPFRGDRMYGDLIERAQVVRARPTHRTRNLLRYSRTENSMHSRTHNRRTYRRFCNRPGRTLNRRRRSFPCLPFYLDLC